MHLRAPLIGLLALTLTPSLVAGQAGPDDRSPNSDIELVSERTSIVPGTPFTVGLHITLEPGWHTYWLNAGDAGLPLLVEWTLPDGFEVGPFEYPIPKRIPVPPLMSYGYEDEVLVLAEVTPPIDLEIGSEVAISGLADWLVCEEICIPASGEVELRLAVARVETDHDQWAPRFDRTSARLPEPADDWNARAWRVESGFVLEVRPPTGIDLPAPYLFSDSMGVVEHPATQKVGRAGGVVRMFLPHAELMFSEPTRIGGLLVADASRGHDTPGWMLEAPLEDVPSEVTAETANSFFDGTVQETGGLDVVTSSAPVGAPAGAGLGLLVALLFAFAGGLLLNLMPCVFPVLSVKVLRVVQQAGGAPGRARRHGLVFAAGVVVSFWLLAGLLYALRGAGESLGWGFHLQSPTIVALLALGMFALGLGMSGVFELGLRFTRLGGAGSENADIDAFLTGALAVLVAAPCTAPFMGVALGYALVQPPITGLAVFSALGLGLAAPYSVLTAAPVLLRRLPMPGPWMVTFKQVLAFPLYATVAWLVWVFARQAGVNAAGVLLLGLTLTAFAAWLAGHSGDRLAVRVGVGASAALAVMLTVLGARAVAVSTVPMDLAALDGGAETWTAFSTERVAALRQQGQPVFVNFTAAWCLSCQVNDRIALRSSAARRAFADANVALLEADWTSRDPRIAEALAAFGRSGVPLYVVYSPALDTEPEILPAILTPAMVVAAVERAAAPAARISN